MPSFRRPPTRGPAPKLGPFEGRTFALGPIVTYSSKLGAVPIDLAGEVLRRVRRIQPIRGPLLAGHSNLLDCSFGGGRSDTPISPHNFSMWVDYKRSKAVHQAALPAKPSWEVKK